MLPVKNIIRDVKGVLRSTRESDKMADATAFVEFMLNSILQTTQESILASDHQSDQVMRLLHALGKSQRARRISCRCRDVVD
ncbi:MAG: hypothetical protein L7F78_04875 [Syntrophales bacterium LBB04]|nr:hypothetical protein [Syntrophales bacterium LBB04]